MLIYLMEKSVQCTSSGGSIALAKHVLAPGREDQAHSFYPFHVPNLVHVFSPPWGFWMRMTGLQKAEVSGSISHLDIRET